MLNISVVKNLSSHRKETKMKDTGEVRIKRAHNALLKHPQTAWWGGVILLGKSEVCDAKFTAYTDGINKKYSRAFLETVDSESKVRGLVMHENLHVGLKHVAYGKKMFKESPKLANMAADFVVNDIIAHIDGRTPKGEKLVELPDGALYHPMFHDWSMRQVFDFLKKNARPCDGKGDGTGKGNGKSDGDKKQSKGQQDDDFVVDIDGETFSPDTLDDHDFHNAKDKDDGGNGGNGDDDGNSGDDDGDGLGGKSDDDKIKDAVNKIDKAIREGGILAGRLGVDVPRVINDILTPKIDWRQILQEFVTTSTTGKSEFTWRKMNKRQLANDFYLPSIEDETIGEVILGNDTSGSISQKDLTEVATEVASLANLLTPDCVRVLWWDTKVHGEQVFRGDYSRIEKLMKPVGGGGTRAGCVSDWLKDNPRVNAECLIMFTDGYLENDIKWSATIPTLWIVTGNKSFTPPHGKVVFMEKDY